MSKLCFDMSVMPRRLFNELELAALPGPNRESRVLSQKLGDDQCNGTE